MCTRWEVDREVGLKYTPGSIRLHAVQLGLVHILENLVSTRCINSAGIFSVNYGNVTTHNINTSESQSLKSSSPTLFLSLHLRVRLESVHAQLGDLISVWVKPSNFTGPSGLRNASMLGQRNGCKTFIHLFSLTAHKPQSLRTLSVYAVNSAAATYLIHIVNCGAFLCSCHHLYTTQWSLFHAEPAKRYSTVMTTLKHSWSMNNLFSTATFVD